MNKTVKEVLYLDLSLQQHKIKLLSKVYNSVLLNYKVNQ